MDSTIAKYKNRYGDIHTFELNERGNIDWKGNFEYCRFGYGDNSDDINMVDPSGGPYIAIGEDMNLYLHREKSMIVDGFICRGDHYEIILVKEY